MRLAPRPCYHDGVVQRGGASTSPFPLWKEDRRRVEEKDVGAASHGADASGDGRPPLRSLCWATKPSLPNTVAGSATCPPTSRKTPALARAKSPSRGSSH